MELVIALSIIFSVVALSIAIYIGEELMKLRDRTERIIDNINRVIDNIDGIIKCINVLEDRIKKED